MHTYSTRKCGRLLVSGLIVGLVTMAFVGWSIQNFFSTNRVRAYYELIDSDQPTSDKPDVQRWANVNHTLMVLDARTMLSILIIKATEAPHLKNNTVKVVFDDPHTYGSDDPMPTVVEGNLSWLGLFESDLQINQTIMIWTKLRFDFDATYYVGGWVLMCASGGIREGYGTFFYVTLKNGEITSITDRSGQIPPSTEMEAKQLLP